MIFRAEAISASMAAISESMSANGSGELGLVLAGALLTPLSFAAGVGAECSADESASEVEVLSLESSKGVDESDTAGGIVC